MAPIAMTSAMATIATTAFEFFMLDAPYACMRTRCVGWSMVWSAMS
jgi:hypothetical protein